MTTPYLTSAKFKTLTAMPSVLVDELEEMAPGWITAKLTARSRWIDARLGKRYETPFSAPVPEAVEDWLARIVTLHAYIRRGVSQLDEQFAEIKADAVAAEDEIKEAAEAVNGLFDLPLRADSGSSGISKGQPYIYSERSPTVWTLIQARRGRAERASGRGTSE